MTISNLGLGRPGRPLLFNNQAEREHKPHFPASNPPSWGTGERAPVPASMPLKAVARVQELVQEEFVQDELVKEELVQELTARRGRVPDETLLVTCVTPTTIILILSDASVEAPTTQSRSYYV